MGTSAPVVETYDIPISEPFKAPPRQLPTKEPAPIITIPIKVPTPQKVSR